MATIVADPRFRLARALVSGQRDAEEDDEGPSSSSSSSSSPQDDAVEIFAALLEETRAACGDASANAALCQFEYGNALFRAAVRRRPMSSGGENDDTREEEDEDDGDQKPAAKDDGEGRRRDIMAAAAMKRSATRSPAVRDIDGNDDDDDSNRLSSSNKRLKATDDDETPHEGNGRNTDGAEHAEIGEVEGDVEGDVGDDDDDDVDFALEMMDASWSIILSHADLATTAATTTANAQRSDDEERRRSWAADQLPRVLRCIGDLHSFRGEHGNAVDAYIRSMQYREDERERWEKDQQQRGRGIDGGEDINRDEDAMEEETESPTLDGLRRRRLLVEAYALVAEALLACPDGEDVVARHPVNDDSDITRDDRAVVLAKADDRLDFARGHYELAREGLEDVLCRYARMAAAKMDLENEKQDIGYLVMTMVGVGNMINEQD